MPQVDHDLEPLHVLEEQAAAEGLIPRTRRRRQDVPHDTDAELGVLGVMLWSTNAADTILELGLDPEHFYAPRHQAVYAAICNTIAAGEKPDAVTVPPRGDGSFDGRDLLSLVAAAPSPTNGPAYARRVMHTARLRDLLAGAIAAADTARNGDLDATLAQVQKLAASQPADDTGTTWTPVDLTAALDGDGPLEPTMLTRSDGHQLLYPGLVHAFNAESESGKSWLACLAVAERLAEGEHVIYLDFEDHATGIVGRLRALGVDRDAILHRLHYVRPDDPIDPVAIATLERLLVDHAPTLAIIDGVTEVMVQNGWSINDNDDAARFLLALPRRISRHGCAVVLIDHVAKDREARGRYGIGAQHKLAGVDGAVYRLEVTSPFGLGRTGTSRITVAKDRPGHIRGYAAGGETVGVLQLSSHHDGDVALSIMCPATDGPLRTRPTTLMEQVATAIQTLNDSGIYPTRNGILADVSGKKKWVAEALRLLIEEGYVDTRPGPNRSQLHALTKPYTPSPTHLSDLSEEF